MSKSIQFKNNENENIYPNPHFPIGSIYLNVVDINPSTWFGGTWEKIAKGKTLVGVDENDTDFNQVKKTGGSKFIQQHSHKSRAIKDTVTSSGGNLAKGNDSAGRNTGFSNWTDDGAIVGDVYGVSSGNSGNLQPYFTCYIWCRIA